MMMIARLVTWLTLGIGIAIGVSASAAAAELREVPVTYPGRDVSLAGLLLLPEHGNRFPAVVIVQGSGESDRRNGWARAISDMMVRAGMAVLLTDKRGSGQSGGDWRTAGFDELAEDALAGVGYLRGRGDIDPRRIGLAGLSQGGRIVPIAAARSSEVAFAINVVGDAVSFGEQSAHEMANIARQSGLDEEQTRQLLALNMAAGRALLTGDWAEYTQLRMQGMTTPWARIAEGFPPAGAPVWTFIGKVATFDPMPYWILVRQPALILYGEVDEQDNVAVAESVRRLRFGFAQVGKTNYQITVVPGVGHLLGWRPEEGLGPAAAEAIGSWLAANVTDSD